MILGIKVRLCSWIWVTAWKMLTAKAGDESHEQEGPGDLQEPSSCAWAARLATVSWFIAWP